MLSLNTRIFLPSGVRRSYKLSFFFSAFFSSFTSFSSPLFGRKYSTTQLFSFSNIPSNFFPLLPSSILRIPGLLTGIFWLWTLDARSWISSLALSTPQVVPETTRPCLPSSAKLFIRVECSFKSSCICRSSGSRYFTRNRRQPFGSVTTVLTMVFSARKRLTALTATGTSSFRPTRHIFLLPLSNDRVKMRFSVISSFSWCHFLLFSNWTWSSSRSTHSSTILIFTRSWAFSATSFSVPTTNTFSFLSSKAIMAGKLLAVNVSLMNTWQGALFSKARAFSDMFSFTSFILATASQMAACTLWTVSGGPRIWSFSFSRRMVTSTSSCRLSSSWANSRCFKNCKRIYEILTVHSIFDASLLSFLSITTIIPSNSLVTSSTSCFFPMKKKTCCSAIQSILTFCCAGLLLFLKLSTTPSQASGGTRVELSTNSARKEVIASHASSKLYLFLKASSLGVTVTLLMPSSQVIWTSWLFSTTVKSAL